MTSTNRENDSSARSAQVWKRVKLSALALSVLMAAGTVGLMALSAGKGEDITGIVAPAVLVTFVSGVVAAVAAFRQTRAQNNRWN